LKNDRFSCFFKSDLGSARILTGCGIAGGKDASRTREIAREILIFPQYHIGEDNYGIFQKTSEDNNCGNWIYFYCMDRGPYDAAFIGKIGDCE